MACRCRSDPFFRAWIQVLARSKNGSGVSDLPLSLCGDHSDLLVGTYTPFRVRLRAGGTVRYKIVQVQRVRMAVRSTSKAAL